ncbi:MAG: M48 family metallopeptidase [Dehalococcoidia bacterium]|nr:M48 family metallopeptidase [Dehalococcoidia bacterium]MDD5495219.1 M48 family metallopeptidase [Dehalococcoidia bacterium]
MWEQIRDNQTRSALLVVTMGMLLLMLGALLGYTLLGDWGFGLFIALLIWIIMTLVAYFQGDSILLSLANAKKIGPDDLPRLYNVVEEMKIACGLEKMPDIYLIDDPALNAFATGRDKNKTSVAVTSGLMERLNRDELQGVIGHEMSHIKNRDVLLMALCGVLLGTIVILAWYGSRFMLFGGMGGTRRSSGSGGGAAQLIIIVVAIVLMILAPIMAQLIYYAISRKREYLADASSALYTRYPEGLASALEKIAASTEPLKSANKATAPMYIMNPFRKQGRAAEDLTSTHPPISERIRILRGMAGQYSLDYYDKAFGSVHKGGGNVIPASAMAGAAALAPAAEAKSAAPAEGMPALTERRRETTDALWKLNDYRPVTCECGMKFKIPPDYTEDTFQCPRCGRTNSLS